VWLIGAVSQLLATGGEIVFWLDLEVTTLGTSPEYCEIKTRSLLVYCLHILLLHIYAK
jgi:hypothetical protein